MACAIMKQDKEDVSDLFWAGSRLSSFLESTEQDKKAIVKKNIKLFYSTYYPLNSL